MLTPEPLRKTLLKKQQQNGKQNAADAKAAADDNRKVIRGWESCKINLIKRCNKRGVVHLNDLSLVTVLCEAPNYKQVEKISRKKCI